MNNARVIEEYQARLTPPEASNKYFLSKDKGGFNTAIAISSDGFVLPNCVGYAQGRFREIHRDQKIWSRIGAGFAGNACTFYNNALQRGYTVGQTPKLGSIAVWNESPNHPCGHVAVVENILSNGDIVTSNSAYNGDKFYIKIISKSDGYHYTKDHSIRPFLGFIYPEIDFYGIEDTKEPNSNVVYIEANPLDNPNLPEVMKADMSHPMSIWLNNAPAYTSESAVNSYSSKSGKFWLWSDEVINGRVKITNSEARIGVPHQITCWINKSDIFFRGGAK